MTAALSGNGTAALFRDADLNQQTASKMAAAKLRKSVNCNVSYTDERTIAALRGIGFALLAIVEASERPAPAPRPRWWRRLGREA